MRVTTKSPGYRPHPRHVVIVGEVSVEEDSVVGVADVGWVRADHHRVAWPIVSHLLKTSPDLGDRVISLHPISLYTVLIERET